MTRYDAREIANFFLDYAQEKGKSVTNLALLKIIYYAHGWHLKMREAPLVKNTFEAWPRGPVIRVVYDAFKHNEGRAIPDRAKRFDVEKNQYCDAEYGFDESLEAFLEQIFDLYADIDPFDLSDMTHAPGGPWDTIMKKSKENICLQLKIPDDLIAEHFKNNERWMM